MQLLPRYFSGATLSFIEMQVRLTTKKGRGRRYTHQDKATALSLYHSNPKTYRLLRKLFLLPTERTLQRHMQAFHIRAGFSDSIISALEIKVKVMQPNTKLCAIVMDEMAIKESISYCARRDEVEGFEDYGLRGKTIHVANHASFHGAWLKGQREATCQMFLIKWTWE